MTLDILIPYYNESDDLLLRQLNSINNQLYVDFDLITVCVVHDGAPFQLSEKVLKAVAQYKFKFKFFALEKCGVSAVRQFAFDHTNSDYVMFCDTDDFFHSNLGLALLDTIYTNCYQQTNDQVDLIASAVVALNMSDPVYDKKIAFGSCLGVGAVHGMAFKRQFLVKNNIKWNKKLTICEDGYFYTLVLSYQPSILATENSFYCWEHRPDSTMQTFLSRKDTKSIEAFAEKNYSILITFTTELAKDLILNKNIKFLKRLLESFLCHIYTLDFYLRNSLALSTDIADKFFISALTVYKDLVNSNLTLLDLTFNQLKIDTLVAFSQILEDIGDHIMYFIREAKLQSQCLAAFTGWLDKFELN